MGDDIASTLSGFALGEVLSSLDLDTSALGALQSQLGIKRSNALNRDSIYADRFADDDDAGLDDDDLEDDREDFEAMIDREMREEKYGKAGAAAVGGAARQAGQAGAAGGRLVRGEEDDFDEDYDEDGDADMATAAAPSVVKEEPTDGDELFGAASPGPSTAAGGQALEVERLAAPPAKKVEVRDLFPQFEPGKTLEFTELFGSRPRKKRRVITEGVKRRSSLRSRFRENASDPLHVSQSLFPTCPRSRAHGLPATPLSPPSARFRLLATTTSVVCSCRPRSTRCASRDRRRVRRRGARTRS